MSFSAGLLLRRALKSVGLRPPEKLFTFARRIKHWLLRRDAVVQSPFVSLWDRKQIALDRSYLNSLHAGQRVDDSGDIHVMADLRVAQYNRERGIPVYSQMLLIELARLRPDIQFSWLIEDGEMPLFADVLSAHGKFTRVSQIASLPRISHYLQACLFQDVKGGVERLFPSALASHQPKLSAILYDLIPWILPDLYLTDSTISRLYRRDAETMVSMDRLFAISECSRIDAVAFGCSPERVVTVYGGTQAGRTEAAGIDPPANLPKNYWLYVGGDDPRKNLLTLVRAFALVHRRLAGAPALVIVCRLTETTRDTLLREADTAGLGRRQLVLTGYVPDEVLDTIFDGAIASIFPALYEGLGLPVLQSYRHGRPALVSNTSSLIELAPPACRFNPKRAQSIADAVIRFHQDPAVAAASLVFGQRVLQMCSWTTAASRVSEWFEQSGTSSSEPEPLQVVTSLPPDESGVALYTQQSLASAPWPVRFLVPWDDERIEFALESLRKARHKQRSSGAIASIVPISQYQANSKPTLWILGNSDHHIASAEMLIRSGRPRDFLYLHEVKLDGLLRTYHDRGQGSTIPEGVRTLADFLKVIRVRNIVVNSSFAAELIRSLPGAQAYQVHQLFLPTIESEPPADEPRLATAASDDTLTVMHIGLLGKSKLPDLLVAACDIIAADRPVRLIFAGYDVAIYLQSEGLLRPWVECQEGLSDDDLTSLMQSADVGVQLRWPQYGESSAAVRQWLSLRKPVIATAGGSFNEFESVARLVPPDTGAQHLATAILQAASSGVSPGIEEFEQRTSISSWLDALQHLLQTPGADDRARRETGVGKSRSSDDTRISL